MNEKKEKFIEFEIWSLTIGGAFQRASIYKQGIDEPSKTDFKEKLRDLVLTISAQYNCPITEETHLQNIGKVESFKHRALVNEHLNFGVSQKLLNLYIKYLWCLNKIPTPPHFPVDRIIQTELEYKPLINWTQIDGPEKYMRIIEHAHAKRQAEKMYNSIAEQELALFKRSSQD